MKEYEERLDRMKRERDGVVENLRTVTTNDTAILKAMKSPPKPVKLVADALAYVLVRRAPTKALAIDRGASPRRLCVASILHRVLVLGRKRSTIAGVALLGD